MLAHHHKNRPIINETSQHLNSSQLDYTDDKGTTFPNHKNRSNHLNASAPTLQNLPPPSQPNDHHEHPKNSDLEIFAAASSSNFADQQNQLMEPEQKQPLKRLAWP